ncbi:MAG: 50S ribosomal protein L2 [DPANN group archaeon]|nr:50S ribosomal protein L2 [DPANN group archaeon]
MGKRIIAQRRGRGSPTYRCPSHNYVTELSYKKVTPGIIMSGIITDIVHDSSRNAPLGTILYSDNTKDYILLSEGCYTGKKIEIGTEAELDVGNILPIGNIPEGTPIFNIENKPGDGGRIIRSSGGYALIISHDEDKTIIKMSSKKLKTVNPKCKATIGVVAGGERKTKPFGQAGTKFYAMKARGKLWPRTSAKAMNAVDHKFGGCNMGVPKTSSRHAPPGAKIGSIAARRTGKKR